MANPILDSQYNSPNALLTTHGFPVNTSGNALLLSHSPAGVYPNPASGALTLTDGVNFTLNGSFADRADTPFYFDNYESHTLDARADAIGLATLGGGWPTAMPLVKNDRSHTGTKSLRMNYPAALDSSNSHPDDDITKLSSFPQIGIDGLSTTTVYVSAWMYWARHTGSGHSGTFKLCRGGAAPPYAGIPQFHETYNGINPVTGVATSDDPDRGVVNSSGSSTYSNTVNASPSRDGWHRLEYYFALGTEGNSDGTFKTWVDGVLNGNMINQPIVASGDSAARINNVISIFDGMDSYPTGTGFYVWMDQFYVDSTQQRLELGNADTWGACTVREVQPSVTWTTTSITATCQKGGVASGARWLYVIAADGTASAGIPVTLT